MRRIELVGSHVLGLLSQFVHRLCVRCFETMDLFLEALLDLLQTYASCCFMIEILSDALNVGDELLRFATIALLLIFQID